MWFQLRVWRSDVEACSRLLLSLVLSCSRALRMCCVFSSSDRLSCGRWFSLVSAAVFCGSSTCLLCTRVLLYADLCLAVLVLVCGCVTCVCCSLSCRLDTAMSLWIVGPGVDSVPILVWLVQPTDKGALCHPVSAVFSASTTTTCSCNSTRV